MNGVQLLLVLVIISLTALLLVIGYQAFLVIREVRFIVKRINSLIDNSQSKIASIVEELKKK